MERELFLSRVTGQQEAVQRDAPIATRGEHWVTGLNLALSLGQA